MRKWKVEIRTTCKVCGKKLPNKRYRTYCSTKCRVKAKNDKQKKDGYFTKYQQARREKIASSYEPGKEQCHVCGGWYRNLERHFTKRHEKIETFEWKS